MTGWRATGMVVLIFVLLGIAGWYALGLLYPGESIRSLTGAIYVAGMLAVLAGGICRSRAK